MTPKTETTAPSALDEVNEYKPLFIHTKEIYHGDIQVEYINPSGVRYDKIPH